MIKGELARRQRRSCDNFSGRCPPGRIDPGTGAQNCAGCPWQPVPQVKPDRCPLCAAGDPSTPVTCFNCHTTYHMHDAQLRTCKPGDLIVSKCPECGRLNAWEKTIDGLRTGKAPVVFTGEVIDLRGKL